MRRVNFANRDLEPASHARKRLVNSVDSLMVAAQQIVADEEPDNAPNIARILKAYDDNKEQ